MSEQDAHEPAMSEQDAHEPASVWRRAGARAIDVAVTAGLAFLLTTAAGCTALVIGVATQSGFGDDQTGTIDAWFILFSLATLIPLARYEVVSTSRRGQTFGKRIAGIQVVQCDDQSAPAADVPPPDLRHSLERWVVPHGAGLLAGVVAGVVAAQKIGYYGVLVGAGAWLAVSTVVYLSSLFDKNGRGWHDKAAGTIVVTAPDPPSEQ